jgi:thiol-disulfide isomerase/thioredoxin
LYSRSARSSHNGNDGNFLACCESETCESFLGHAAVQNSGDCAFAANCDDPNTVLELGHPAPAIPGLNPGSGPALVVFFETNCPTCRLAIPYLNKLAQGARVIGISQDDDVATNEFTRQLATTFAVQRDPGFVLSRAFELTFVPSLFLLNPDGRILQSHFGFDKSALNEIAAQLRCPPVAAEFDGTPHSKPGCMSRHLEPRVDGESAPAPVIGSAHGVPASIVEIPDGEDPLEYCFETFGDGLPVIPPTPERIAHMLSGVSLERTDIVARVPPCYGEATLEKIAANAVMAGCVPDMMRVLLPLVRAVCDERLNIHGVQATTHFAAPLVIINGPIRNELRFAYRQNVFSNVARANSTLGRALQLILLNIGGARPDGIDMSTLGNPGKFSYCIAEHEEANPWEPFHVECGFNREQSALTLFAAEAPHGVSEHTARTPEQVLQSISYALATVWTYRLCLASEALVVLSPEHAQTIHRAGWSKQNARDFLFENTGVPLRAYEGAPDAEGSQMAAKYKEILINGERCYQKFRSAESIRILVAGGTAGKFSAVIGSWVAGPRGSEMVTYPI